MNKVIVLGCPGSGKSTFARKLHACTGLPLYYLDQIWWKSDRTHIDRDEFDLKLSAILAEEKWIIDGNYSRTYEVRMKECDTIFFLNYGVEECLLGIHERMGKKREDMPWIEEKEDPELMELVLRFSADNVPVIMELINRYSDKDCHIFNSRDEADQWLVTYSK